MFAGIVRIKVARRELKHETELLWKNCGFHCHVEKELNASATVLILVHTAYRRKPSEHVMGPAPRQDNT